MDKDPTFNAPPTTNGEQYFSFDGGEAYLPPSGDAWLTHLQNPITADALVKLAELLESPPRAIVVEGTILKAEHIRALHRLSSPYK